IVNTCGIELIKYTGKRGMLMLALGVGVLIFSIAFAVLVGYLSYTLYGLTKVINGVGKTVEQLPDQLDDVFEETGNILHESNKTVADLNEKMRALNPLFEMTEDVTEATRSFCTFLAETTNELKEKKDAAKDESRSSKCFSKPFVFARSLFKRSKQKISLNRFGEREIFYFFFRFF